MEKTKNVFISHYSNDEENIDKLRNLISDKGYNIKNSSVDSSKPNFAKNPEYVKRLLRMRIQWAGTFICLIGPQTYTREWVDWEIDQANKKGKRIVGIYLNGASESNVPESFNKYGDALVGWTSEKIVGAIEGEINNFENPDGTQRKPYYEPNRKNC